MVTTIFLVVGGMQLAGCERFNMCPCEIPQIPTQRLLILSNKQEHVLPWFPFENIPVTYYGISMVAATIPFNNVPI